MAKRSYIIYCDESEQKGPHFSNFYGGALVSASDREAIESHLSEKKEELNLFGELKWNKITRTYQDKYIEFIRFFFGFVAGGRIKIRIMFTQNYYRPVNLEKKHHDNRYFLLYYQMIKHSFGLVYCNPNAIDRVYVTLLLDQVPDTDEKFERFKDYLTGIGQTKLYEGSRVFFPRDQIAGVDSKKHNILQGLDIILGSIFFRLNDLHKLKPEDAWKRGKRTIAKENVYKEVNALIRSIYPNFNIGISTGTANGLPDRWNHPYRHWNFVPQDFEIDIRAAKPR